jgi:hypothetical protein
VIAASVFKRSRVDRASRSSRVTINTSPAASVAIAFRSCARSVLAPLATSRNTFPAPAAFKAATCAATFWPSVDTRAYPYLIAYDGIFCKGKAFLNQCAKNFA